MRNRIGGTSPEPVYFFEGFMVFSSILFLFWFFPIVIVISKIMPKSLKNLWLFLASLVFYAWGEPVYILIMLFSTFFDYNNGRLMIGASNKKKKSVLILSIVVNLGILFFFKYSDLFIRTINNFGFDIEKLHLKLPLGISFYTFQTLSYTIDVYRGRVEPADNIIDFGLFVTSFPQLIAGPIVKYIDVHKELKNRDDGLENTYTGLIIFLQGLFMKVLIANRMGEIFELYSYTDASSGFLIIMKLVAYTFQIFFDFAGYSKMAIGMGKMLGFDFPENFNYPYISKSVTEFWRRWHMTLSSWFKEYVYIPLGGNRVGKVRHIFNLFLTWFLTGLWHGADYNFILWGLYFFLILIIEKYILGNHLKKWPALLSWSYTIAVVMFGWLLFTSTNLSDVSTFFRQLGTLPFFRKEDISYLMQYGIMFIIAIIFSGPRPKKEFDKMPNAIKHIILIVLFILSISMITTNQYNPFLYFRF